MMLFNPQHNDFVYLGHAKVCQYLLETAGERAKDLANARSMSLNTPIMWAAWSGSLDVTKLLVSHGADPHFCNKEGCTSAHWAAAGGNVDVCKYLYEELGVNFNEPDHSGNVPLNHAINYRQDDVVKWLLTTFYSDPDGAATLLQDEKITTSLMAKVYLKDWQPDEEMNKVVLEQLKDFPVQSKKRVGCTVASNT